MKSLIIGLLLLNSYAAFTQTHKHDHAEHKASPSLTQSDAKVVKFLLKKNDELFNKLLKGSQDEVANVSKQVATIAKNLKSEELKELKLKVSALEKISNKNTKDQNLNAYGEFLPALVEVVKKYRPDANYQIYYCPMIKKNWIQDQRTNSAVRNVFAQDMLECGGKES